MSLPREIQAELLSAYLDDALSGDERQRVEQILARDEQARALLERMRSLQASSKVAMHTDRRPSAGLSDRVIAEAMVRADQEDLPARHHVRLAASQKARQTPANRADRRAYRPVAAALALAAALLLSVTLWNGWAGPDGGPETATGNGVGNGSQNPAVAEAGGPAVEDVEDTHPNGWVDDADAVAETVPPVDSVVRSEATDRVDVPEDVTSDSSPESPEMAADADNAPPASAVASADSTGSAADRNAADNDRPLEMSADEQTPDLAIDDPAAMLANSAVMIFEVEQTETGRAANAVLREMREAGIKADLRQQIDDAVVGYLQEARLVAPPGEESDSESASNVSVVYVEASGKQLDQFMVRLFADTTNVARIGWNLAMDAPLVKAATQIGEVVATDVRHAEDSSQAWQIVAGETQQGFARPEGGREFMAIDRANADAWNALSSANTGADIRSRLLILIR